MRPTSYFSLRSRLAPASASLLPMLILGALALLMVIGPFVDIGSSAV